MSGIFDQLNQQLGGGDDGESPSPLDLRDMPPDKQGLMRFLIREHEVSYDYLLENIDDLPTPLTQEQLDSLLIELTEERWIIKFGTDNVSYEINLRKKRESTLAKSIWGSLDARIAEQQKQRKEQEEQDNSSE